jgi:hypothetical protein
MEHQLDATVTVLLISKINKTVIVASSWCSILLYLLIYEHLCFCKVARFYCVGRNNSTSYDNYLSVTVVPFCACRWNVNQCTACCGWSSTENAWSLQSIIQHPQYSVGRIGKGTNGAQKYIIRSYKYMTCTWQATVSCDFDFCEVHMMNNVQPSMCVLHEVWIFQSCVPNIQIIHWITSRIFF